MDWPLANGQEPTEGENLPEDAMEASEPREERGIEPALKPGIWFCILMFVLATFLYILE